MLAALGALSLVNSARALDPARSLSQYTHDRWGADRGFVGGAIYSISQSPDGYLWIGTERGLLRFDGFTFTLMQRPLPDEPALGPVRSLATDHDGNLWVRLEGPRLLRYRDGRFEDVFASHDLQGLTLTAMALGNLGHLLLSGLGANALRFYDGNFHPIPSDEDPPSTAISMAETRDGRIWVGTQDDGVFGLHSRRDQGASVLPGTTVNALLPAVNGGLWIGTNQGLYLWDTSGGPKDPPAKWLPGRQIFAIYKDTASNIWVGTDRGLVRITAGGLVSQERLERDPGSSVTAIFQDRDGDLWFGGSRGLERMRDGAFTTYSTGQGLPPGSNGAVYVDSDGRTWFAPLRGGLYWLREGQVVPVTVAGLGRDVVYSISGGEDEVWVGRQSGGLTQLRSSGNRFVARTYTEAHGLAQNRVYSVHENRDGTVWAGTVSGGVSRLRDGVFTTYSTANGLASNAVNSIVEGYDGTMWFATPSGVASFDQEHWRNLTSADGLPSSNVGTIYEDSRHVLWIATSAGLAYLSNGRVQVPRNLPDSLREQVFGIAEDRRGTLWITTPDHVLQVNRDGILSGNLQDTDVRVYGIDDGLSGVEGVRRDRSVVADSMGRVWVSLNHGVAVADKKIDFYSAVPARVRMESMSTDQGSVTIQGELKIGARPQRITFNFAGSNLSDPGRVRFRYKLDGFDRGWSATVATRQANYTNLGPGDYRFRVIASDSEGLWNGAETVVPFRIERAPWETWWFRSICLLAGGILILALVRLRIYQLKQQLNAQFQARLDERTRIAQDLHDTLLQGFLSASMQLDVAEDQLPADSPSRPALRHVLRLMGQVIEEGRNALRGLRNAETDNHDLEVAFSRIRHELATDSRIAYRVMADTETRRLHPAIRDEVYRIGREALVNAFLHARASTVEVEVKYASTYLRVLVRDDGCGIDPQVLYSGREGHWGLPGMRERSQCIGGSLRLRSRMGAGTEVELTVPAAIAFEGHSARSLSHWLPWLSRERFEGGTGAMKSEDARHSAVKVIGEADEGESRGAIK